MSVPNSMAVHPIVVKTFHKITIYEVDKWEKVGKICCILDEKSVKFTFCGLGTSVQNKWSFI